MSAPLAGRRIVVTGAQCYDQWFGWQPSRSREEFCVHAGLDPAKPFVLYVCSSLFKNTANEARFAEQWIQHVRGSADPALRGAGILIRPHPRRLEEWQEVDLTEFKNVAFFGSHPVDPSTKNDYFDSLYYAAAVVGLNTSAMLEAAVVGKRDALRGEIVKAFVVLASGFEPSDELVRTLQEHVKQTTAPYKYPREIEFRDELPKTVSGKIRRNALREEGSK